jgi:hypothetical protein
MTTAVRHSLNVDFAWVPPRPPFRFVTGEQEASYNEQGFFVIEHVLDPKTVAAVAAEIDPMEHELEDLLRQVEGGKIFIARADEITFTTHLVARSPAPIDPMRCASPTSFTRRPKEQRCFWARRATGQNGRERT